VKTLGENVGELHHGGNMENTDNTNGYPFPDEVEVDLHVFSTLMLNRVGGEVDGTAVVAVHEAGGLQRMVELL